MKWEDTMVAQYVYGDIAKSLWGEWEIIWEHDSNNTLSFLARRGHRYVLRSLDSNADEYEPDDVSSEEIRELLRRGAHWFESKSKLYEWLDCKEGQRLFSSHTAVIKELLDPPTVEVL